MLYLAIFVKSVFWMAANELLFSPFFVQAAAILKRPFVSFNRAHVLTESIEQNNNIVGHGGTCLYSLDLAHRLYNATGFIVFLHRIFSTPIIWNDEFVQRHFVPADCLPCFCLCVLFGEMYV